MRDAGVWLTPNLIAYTLIARPIGRPQVIDSVLRFPESKLLDSGLKQLWRGGMYTNRPLEDAPSYERSRAFLVQVTGGLHAAGVRMLAGTDTPLPALYPGKSLIEELDLLVSAGLSQYDALATATRNAGEFIAAHIRSGMRVGTVTVGSRADLVLVDTNPLESFSSLAHPAGTMIGGRWFTAADLSEQLSGIRR